MFDTVFIFTDAIEVKYALEIDKIYGFLFIVLLILVLFSFKVYRKKKIESIFMLIWKKNNFFQVVIMLFFNIVLVHSNGNATDRTNQELNKVTKSNILMSNEIQLSASGIKGDGKQFYAPKIMIYNGNPIVFFWKVDEKILIASHLSEDKNSFSITNHKIRSEISSPPDILKKSDYIEMVYSHNEFSNSKCTNKSLVFYKYNVEIASLERLRKMSIPCNIISNAKYEIKKGLYLLSKDSNEYLMAFEYRKSFGEISFLWSGHNKSVMKHFTIKMKNDATMEPQIIEQDARIGTYGEVYYTTFGNHSFFVGIQDNANLSRNNKSEDILICCVNAGDDWKRPIEIFKSTIVDGFNGKIRDISIQAYEDFLYLTWFVVGDGVYVAKINTDLKNFDIKRIKESQKDSLASSMPTYQSKVMKDEKGNLFVLLIKHQNERHEIHIMPKINGEWFDSIKIAEGEDFIRLPEIIIEPSGILHLAYFKSKLFGSASCYYRKIDMSSL